MPRLKKWKPNSSYFELLKDPRWQKKRLEIFERDGFKCRSCDGSEKTLNVHHCFYNNDLNPWDYPQESLVTLCEECHLKEKAELSDSRKMLLDTLGRLGFMSEDLGMIQYDIWRIITSSGCSPFAFGKFLQETANNCARSAKSGDQK